MEQKIFDSTLYCIIHRSEEWREGLDFLTDDAAFVQAGTWWYQKDKQLEAHWHNKVDRIANLTQETVIVMAGSLEVNLYNPNQEKLDTFVLLQGDLGIFLDGGHGYKILEDDTKIIEVKNGPFLGVEIDKTKFGN